jgi:hypothetical protein
MHNAPGSRQSESTSDNKPRGANRSTKVAGKLKVLPEQPELVPVKSPVLNESQTARGDAAASGGESEDGDISSEDNELEDAEVEVCVNFMAAINGTDGQHEWAADIRYTINFRSYQMELQGEMH